MAEPNLIYKLTLLYLLSQTQDTLSNAQVTEFFIHSDYTDYLTVQKTVHDLEASGMITAEHTSNQTFYRITDEGRQTLLPMQDRITSSIRQDTKAFFSSRGLSIRDANAIRADYEHASGGGYLVRCRVTEDDATVMDLTFHVSGENQAKTICTNWKKDYEAAYAAFMDLLLRD